LSKSIKPYQLLRDIRVEVFIAGLIQRKSLKSNQFLVRPVGIFKRPFSRDILKIQILENEMNSAYYEIEVSREGLYDMLPEGLFHKITNTSKKTDSKDIKVNQGQRNEEDAARKFFLPLEQEFFKERIHLELEEQNAAKLANKTKADKHGVSINKFWGIHQVFTKNQKLILLYLLPQVHKIAGNFSFTGKAISLVLGKNVAVSFKYGPASSRSGFKCKSVAEMTLGVDSILGNQFVDGLPTIVIRVSLKDEGEVFEFLEEGLDRKRLKYLCNYLLPVGYPIELEIVVINMKEPFILSEDKDNYLGYTTKI